MILLPSPGIAWRIIFTFRCRYFLLLEPLPEGGFHLFHLLPPRLQEPSRRRHECLLVLVIAAPVRNILAVFGPGRTPIRQPLAGAFLDDNICRFRQVFKQDCRFQLLLARRT